MRITLKATIDPRALSDHTHTVYVRITHQRKIKYIATGVRVLKGSFNTRANYEKGNWIRSSAHGYAQANMDIRRIMDRIKKLIDNDPDLSIDQVASLIKGADTSDLTSFWQEYLSKQNKVKLNTLERYKGYLAVFKEFCGDKLVPFSAVNYNYIMKYEDWQLKRNKPISVNKSMAVLRRVTGAAIKAGHLKKNPFDDYQPVKYTVQKSRLSREEITLFEANRTKHRKYRHAVNCFLMQYYCAGARVSDVIKMKWSDIRDGRWEYHTGKGDKYRNVKLAGKALEILEEYSYNKEGYVFPWLTETIVEEYGDRLAKKIEVITAIINPSLKKYAAMIGITKKISSHVSRHTFADLARKETKDLFAVSKALGHGNISMTQIYINSLDDGDSDGLLDQLHAPIIPAGDLTETEMRALKALLLRALDQTDVKTLLKQMGLWRYIEEEN